jgi:uncharacterized membrane protein YphA (DoxX/SURF4 family)
MKTNIKNIILLIIRILVGGMIAYAGYVKLSDMDQTLISLGGMTGLSSGFIWAVALGELVSGLGIVFGVWTRLASLGTVIIMVGAVYFTKGENMSALLLLIGSIAITIFGGGKWALVTYKTKHIMPDLPVAAKF